MKEVGREWRLPALLYADDIVLCGESDEDLRVMVGWFADVCRRREEECKSMQVRGRRWYRMERRIRV